MWRCLGSPARWRARPPEKLSVRIRAHRAAMRCQAGALVSIGSIEHVAGDLAVGEDHGFVGCVDAYPLQGCAHVPKGGCPVRPSVASLEECRRFTKPPVETMDSYTWPTHGMRG